MLSRRAVLSLLPAAAVAQTRRRYPKDETAGFTTDRKISYWQQRLTADPKDLNAALKLSAAFLQKTRETADFSYVDKAASLVDRVFTASPDNYEALRLRLQVAMNHHRFPKAVDYAEALLDRNPGDSGVTGLLGDALMEMGHYDDAERAYKRLMDLRADLYSYNRVAWHRFVTGKADEALAWMSKAVESGSPEPENEAWCLVEFGDLLFKTGKTPAARQSYERALAKFPAYHRANGALGHLTACEGDQAAAIVHYKKAQTAVPFPEYAAALDHLHRAAGNLREADRQRAQVDLIDKLGQASGEKANRTLALIFANGNRKLDRAYELAKGEFEIRGSVYDHDALGWVLHKMGKLEAALESSQKATALNTPEPSLHFHAGMIAKAAGKTEAKALLAQALALNPRFDWIDAPEAKRALAAL